MEAVPRLHMLWFPSKTSPEGTSFNGLKKYIAEYYQENPDNYNKELYALETLRNQALNTPKDNCAILKRYFCQLESLLNRFPKLRDKKVIFHFTWKDLYNNKTHEYNDIGYEQAAVLFNIATAHTQAGASVNRTDVEGMKLACTHFQCAAWAYGGIRERYLNMDEFGDCFTTELLVFMQQVSLAQAQECILEKSLIDNRKPNIVAKVTAQIVVYYGAALAALLTGGDDGPVSQVVDSSVYKQWKKYVRFKISYLNCILYLYQGQHAEEQRKMGERVTLFEAAWEKLEEARKESKSLPDQKEIIESIIFTADVVEAKRKNAKNENEFIYHESIPELSSLSAVQGANLVNGIAFSVTDPDVAGEDIFARLVPMKAHESSSMYSEEKAKLLRKYGSKIEEKDGELASFMNSLTLDNLNINEEKANKIPQGIVDRCAALNASKTAIPELCWSMARLAEVTSEVEANLKEIANILEQEDKEEKEFQQLTGVQRTPNAHITELAREFQKYTEAHNRAGESNDTLRKAMMLHINNLKILAKPLQEIQQSVPKLSSELNTTEVFKDVKLIVNKVNEMKAQRSQFHADLRIAVNDDDITAKIIAHDCEDELQGLFEHELAKHEKLTQLIDQNLLAQENILKALTESYAKAAPVLKTLADVKHKRESFFASLAASYDVYEDLLAKSAKGVEFYKKLSANVQKLLSRCKSARDVQSEERQQRLKSVPNKPPVISGTFPPDNYNNGHNPAAHASSSTSSSTPKLRDYLKAKKEAKEKNIALGGGGMNSNYNTNSSQFIPPVRPSPLGSENPSQAVCSGNSSYYTNANAATNPVNVGPATVGPNEPPPPYSVQQTQYYDPNAAGYTNPMYYQYQQNVAPPAYKPQASPNSQFTSLNAGMSGLSLQQGMTAEGNYIPLQYSNNAGGNNPAINNDSYSNFVQGSVGGKQPQSAVGFNQQQQHLQQQQQQVQQLQQQQQQAPSLNNLNPQTNIQQQSSTMGSINAKNNYNSMPLIPAHQNIGAYNPNTNTNQEQLYMSAVSHPHSLYNPSHPTSTGMMTNSAYSTQQTSQSPFQTQQMNTPSQTAQSPYQTQQMDTQPVGESNQIPMGNQQQYGTHNIGMPQGYQNQQLQQLNNMNNSNAIQNNVQANQPLYVATNQTAPSLPAPGINNNQQYPNSAQQQMPINQAYNSTAASTGILPQQTQQQNQVVTESKTNTDNVSYYGQQNVTPQPLTAPPMATTASASVASASAGRTSTSSMHPGFIYNPQTGTFEYGSGYQATSNTQPFYGKYTTGAEPGNSQVGTTDSISSGKSNSSTGFDSPIISHTKTAHTQPPKENSEVALSKPNTTTNTDVNYYNPPYGYQLNQSIPSNLNNMQVPQIDQAATPASIVTAQNNSYQPSQSSQTTYMQSGTGTTANTQTTKSGNTYATSSQQAPLTPTPKDEKKSNANVSAASKNITPVKPTMTPKKSSNIDLLTDVDFSIGGLAMPSILPEPSLKPMVISSPANSQVAAGAVAEPIKKAEVLEKHLPEQVEKIKQVADYVNSIVLNPLSPVAARSSAATLTSLNLPSSPVDVDSFSPAGRKASFDNLSICSDLSSLDNFDWDSVSMQGGVGIDKLSMENSKNSNTTLSASSPFQLKAFDPFTDDKILKYFHKDVERFEKIVESLNVKMLNGQTSLTTKWKELQDLLTKDGNKRTTTIAKLFPEKNRSVDCLPYDHARVKLDKETDDYINAAFVKNLGTGCPNMIIAQTPQQNTINDFWSMIWSQKARTVLCLHTPNEMLDPFWPQIQNKEANFDDFSVKCIKIVQLSHCVEYQLNLTMLGSDAILDLAILQIKTWTKSTPPLMVGIARNAVQAHQQRCLSSNSPLSPLILNCLTGSERSELVAIAVSAILATQNKRPILINVIDVWLRICQQRQQALKDVDTLEQSLQIVLNQAHDVLNKRGIMTSYQMKIAPQVTAQEKQATKDPLNDLDALWKLK